MLIDVVFEARETLSVGAGLTLQDDGAAARHDQPCPDVLGVGAELGATNNDSAVVTALRRGTTDSLNQAGQQVVRRNLNIQPTITIRPGFPVRVIVNRDLVLAPYQS